MIIAFIFGFLAVLASVVIIKAVVVGINWLKNYIKQKLEARKNHKVAFVDTREAVDEYIKDKERTSDSISMDELENICEETPFVSAYYDEDEDEISDYERISANEIETKLDVTMKQNDGIMVFG